MMRHVFSCVLACIVWCAADQDAVMAQQAGSFYHSDIVELGGFASNAELFDANVMFNPVNEDVYIYLRNEDRTIMRWTTDGKVDTLGRLDLPEAFIKGNMSGQVLEDGRRIWFWQRQLGQVFEYDIPSGSTTMISETILMDFMHGNASLVTPDETLWAIGGYGYWEFKNLLLTFGRTSYRGWYHSPPIGKAPSRGIDGRIWYRRESHELLYLVPELRQIPTPEASDSWLLYSYSIDSNEWRKIRHFRTSRMISTGGQDSKFHSTDGRLFHINQGFMLDLQSLEIMYMDRPDLGFLRMFHSPRLDRWVLVGYDLATQKANFRVTVVDPSELRFESVTIHPLLSSPVMTALLITLCLIVIAAITLVVYMIRRRAARRDPPLVVSANPQIVFRNGDVQVVKDGLRSYQTDPNLIRLWHLIHRLRREGRWEILLTDLDKEVFLNQQSLSQTTRMRKKLFDVLHQQMGRPFITEDKSTTDSRYKVVRLDLDGIEFIELEEPVDPD